MDGESSSSNCSVAECFQYKSNKQACKGVKVKAVPRAIYDL